MDYSFWTSTAMKFGIQINTTLETDSLLAINWLIKMQLSY